ncbi:MAG: hypothetical protein KAG53_03795 [Endozoicomonadaceae bacterium]|nr:hypothetical protein [Endozoicomonadaceae bacterium]
MSPNKDAVRKTKVFNALDAMKEEGDKITAQKLATLVNMGKQTVLPFYREWQELDVLGDSEGIELSAELLQALKRELTKDKFRQSERQIELEERIEDQRTSFDKTITKREQEIKSLSVEREALECQNEQFNTENLELQSQTAEQLSAIKVLESQYTLAETQLKTAELKLQASENSKEKALQEQEKRLNNANQTLLDHWLAVVDTEKREKIRLQKLFDGEREKRFQIERQLSETRATINQLNSTLEKVNSEYEIMQKRVQQLVEGPAAITETLSLMLGNPKDLTKFIRDLQDDVKLLESVHVKNKLLTTSLEDANKKLATFVKISLSNKQLEKEIIRLQAYTDGLQAATKEKTFNTKEKDLTYDDKETGI